jgi:hypothetical protein
MTKTRAAILNLTSRWVPWVPSIAITACAGSAPTTTAPPCPTSQAAPLATIALPKPSDRNPRVGRFACNWSGEILEPHVTYHVSPSGDDRHDGSSLERAFRTLQRAANLTRPGDVVLVHGGTYSGVKGEEAVLRIQNSGTERAPITFKAAPGEHPVIQNNTWQAIQVADASYVVIDGFELIGQNDQLTKEYALQHRTDKTNPDTNAQGVQIWNYKTGGRSHHVILRNSRIHGFGGSAITGSECDCVTIAENTLYSSGFYSIWGGYGVNIWQPRPLVQAPGYRFVIRDNRVFDIWSYVPYVDAAGVTEPLTNAAIMLDLFTQHGHAGPVLVAGNVVFRNQGCGIQNYEAINTDVVNNTLYENLLDAGVDWGEFCDFRSHGSRVINNVLVAGKGHRATFLRATIPDATFHHNLYWPADAGVAQMGPEDRYGDPRFVSVAGSTKNGRISAEGWDFHLTEGSAAMDSGDSESAPSMDADGKQRPSGRGADRGAYER